MSGTTERVWMSNSVNVVRTRFQSLDSDGSVFSTTFGVRVYDDYGCTYVNLIDSEVELMALDAGALVEFVQENNETAAMMLSSAADLRTAVFVDSEQHLL